MSENVGEVTETDRASGTLTLLSPLAFCHARLASGVVVGSYKGSQCQQSELPVSENVCERQQKRPRGFWRHQQDQSPCVRFGGWHHGRRSAAQRSGLSPSPFRASCPHRRHSSSHRFRRGCHPQALKAQPWSSTPSNCTAYGSLTWSRTFFFQIFLSLTPVQVIPRERATISEIFLVNIRPQCRR